MKRGKKTDEDDRSAWAELLNVVKGREVRRKNEEIRLNKVRRRKVTRV